MICMDALPGLKDPKFTHTHIHTLIKLFKTSEWLFLHGWFWTGENRDRSPCTEETKSVSRDIMHRYIEIRSSCGLSLVSDTVKPFPHTSTVCQIVKWLKNMHFFLWVKLTKNYCQSKRAAFGSPVRLESVCCLPLICFYTYISFIITIIWNFI